MKKSMFLQRFFTLAILLCGISSFSFAKNEVVELSCEYRSNPIGIDVKKPRLSWKIQSEKRNVSQTAYEIRIASEINALTSKKQLWSGGKVNSTQSVNVEYPGPELKSMDRVYWQVRWWDQNNKVSDWSEVAFWEMGLLNADQWKASFIRNADIRNVKESYPATIFRKEFEASKKVSSARLYVTALGLYEIHVNGNRVGDELFTPGWTSYNKRLQYQSYDVSDLIEDNNAIGASLGDGWYRGNIGWGGQRNYYGEHTALLVQLQLNYFDGTSELIVSDGSWKSSTGAILESDIYNGETYDARKVQKGWTKVGFDDQLWKNAVVIDQSKANLIAPQGVPVKIIEEIEPIELIHTPNGETVVDMGQNMVGWVRLKVKGNAGDKVTLQFAEVLDKEGNFYTDNLRSAKCTDVYILNGDGIEIYEPHFTFHGFRYVKVENLPGVIDLETITGIVIHSDMPQTGNFSCSDSLINQLQHNIQWGQKGNFLDVPTDCPQRDERLGWTGDAQVFCATAAFNYDVAAFFTKWMRDVEADQLEDGKVPHVIPDVLKGGGGATAWADASIVIPWNMYLAYGDRRILEVQYNSMKQWVSYMSGRAGDDHLWTGDYHFGDWLAFATTRSDYPGATTQKDLIATAYYAYSSGLLGRIAGIIGEKDDAEKYQALSEKIKQAFIHEFVTPSGRLVSHTQTAYCLALAFELLPEELIKNSAKYLADDVRSMGHLTTGFVGTPLLCKTLSDHGYADLAFMLLNRKEYPSWLYPVTQGATTIWERWDGQKPDGSFQSVGMNSFNHYAYGAIGEWLYRYVAGIEIDPLRPGYKHFILSPHVGGGLTNAAAELETTYGTISSSWKIENKALDYKIQIPVNTTATVTLPFAKANEVKVDGVSLTDKIGKYTQEGDNVVLKLGSGQYSFSSAFNVEE